MLRSMTGFGRCFIEDSRVSQQWEIKSVNGRFLDLKWRLPPLVRYLEPALEKVARRKALRGRVEISLGLQFAPGASPRPAFDAQQASAMLDELRGLAKSRGEDFSADYSQFLAMPALWGEPEIGEIEDLSAMLERGLETALEDWNESRLTEGAQLGADLRQRADQMREWLAALSVSAPSVRDDRVQTLRERLSAILADSGFELSEERFLQEIVIMTDRLDVSEELTRLSTHLARIGQLLASGGEAGRKLDFTLQECFREINTCGNKIQDAELSRLVVDFKNELEKCREQAQNLE